MGIAAEQESRFIVEKETIDKARKDAAVVSTEVEKPKDDCIQSKLRENNKSLGLVEEKESASTSVTATMNTTTNQTNEKSEKQAVVAEVVVADGVSKNSFKNEE